MSKADWFATLGIFTLLIFIVFFCQCIYEQRLPQGERENAIRITHDALQDTATEENCPETSVKSDRSQEINIIEVTMTAYSSDRAQTQGNPFETASTLIVNQQDLWELKYVAISRDLRKKYNLEWGDSIYVEFIVVDLMGRTAQGKITENTIDWFMETEEAALQFGKQPKRKIIILEEEK